MVKKGWIAFSLAITTLTIGCGNGNVTSSSGLGGSGTTASNIPTISYITPTSVGVGTAMPVTIVAYGSNFVSGSFIQWNGTALATTSGGASTALSAQIPASDLAIGGVNQVTVVNPGTNGGTSNAETFDVTNPLPVLNSISPAGIALLTAFTLTVTGSDFETSSQITWNGAALTTTFKSSTQLSAQVPAGQLTAVGPAQISVVTPAPGGGQSSIQVLYIDSGTTRMAVVPVQANDIAWDSTDGLIYASVPGTTGTNGTIVAINPVTGSLGIPQTAGSVPNQLAISSDASFLWVANDGTGTIQRFNLPGLTPNLNIPLPLTIYGTIPETDSLQSAPGSPHTVAVDAAEVITIYDDATPRPTSVSNYGSNWLQWGADSTTIYSLLSIDDPTSSYELNVNSSGVSIENNFGYVIAPFGAETHYDPQTGYLYADNGQVEEAATGELVGAFNLNAFENSATSALLCVPDSSQGVVYFLGQIVNPSGLEVDGYQIEAFDQKTYKPLRTLLLPPIVEGIPLRFIRWGNAGLAFNTGPFPYASSAVPATYIVDGAFVNSLPADTTNGQPGQILPVLTSMSPQSAIAGSGNLTLTVTGNNFENGAIVYWNSIPLSTVFVNSGQLQAAIPASDISNSGADFITVSNGSTATQALSTLTFSVNSSGSGITALNIVALDVAWDKNSSMLYASVSSSDPQYPNSVVAINPSNGQVANSQFAGTDPYLVRTSADGSYLYAGSQTGAWVTQMQLPGLSSPLSWLLGRDNYGPAVDQGPYYALDIQPSPIAPQSTAIATGLYYTDPPGAGVTIFDNNVARPIWAQGRQGGGTGPDASSEFGSLQWKPDGSTIYAANNLVTTYDFYTLGVNSSGVGQANDYPNVFDNPNAKGGDAIHYDAGTGYLYDDDGQVINPATGTQVGTYGASGIAAPDSSLNTVFILGQTSTQKSSGMFTIQSFNQTSFALENSITLSGIVGYPEAMVRWGASGLAIATYNPYNVLIDEPMGMLYILNNANFVSANVGRISVETKPELVQRTWEIPRHSFMIHGRIPTRDNAIQRPTSNRQSKP